MSFTGPELDVVEDTRVQHIGSELLFINSVCFFPDTLVVLLSKLTGALCIVADDAAGFGNIPVVVPVTFTL